MLQNAYFLAKIGADTAENEQHFAEILPTITFDKATHLAVLSPGAVLLGIRRRRRPGVRPGGLRRAPGASP